MKSFQRSEKDKHEISYPRNIHMNLCLKKQNKTGWFSMCEVLKINTPTFSGHFNFLTSSLLFSKSQKLCKRKD